MTKQTNRQIILDSQAVIEETAGLIADLPDTLDTLQLHTLNGLANHIADHASRIRYRIGLILDGKE